MPKNIFLASSFADVSELFSQSMKEPLKGKSVAFIPTASIHEEVTFYVDDAKNVFQEEGLIVNEIDISTAEEKVISETISHADFLYISGGNTFFLLSELRRTGADKLIIEHVNAGKWLIGESAGAIVLSADISYVKDMDNYELVKNLESYKSLNLIDFYPLPHYKEYPFQECTEKIVSEYTGKIDLRPFSNTEAILLHGGEYKVVTR